MVPQGGNTGLVGAGVPDGSGRMAVMSLARLNRIREIDPLNDTITAEAGCVLEAVQNAAAEAGRLFPLALGAQGSCQIGGNLASNAGGVSVLRYGMARSLVLGLEVVLADGRIWDGLRSLRKDNTGYDLKQLFIGAEGTLGVITAAVLRLVPRPRERQTAWLGVGSPRAAVELLALFRERLGETVSSFELLAATASSWCCAICPARARRSPGGALARARGGRLVAPEGLGAARAGARGSLAARADPGRGDRRERGATQAAVGAAGESDRGDGSRGGGAAPRHRGPGLARPGSDRARRGRTRSRRARDTDHAVRPCRRWQHPLQSVAAPDMPGEAFYARRDEVQGMVFDLVEALGGSISAEHGIGRLKRAELARRKSPVELALMRQLKAALDPKGILNPGAVI